MTASWRWAQVLNLLDLLGIFSAYLDLSVVWCSPMTDSVSFDANVILQNVKYTCEWKLTHSKAIFWARGVAPVRYILVLQVVLCLNQLCSDLCFIQMHTNSRMRSNLLNLDSCKTETPFNASISVVHSRLICLRSIFIWLLWLVKTFTCPIFVKKFPISKNTTMSMSRFTMLTKF